MKWVLFADHKPEKIGRYFWRGKNNYGGHSFFDGNQFEFDKNVPVNKVSDDYLEWLDESEDNSKIKNKMSN